MMAAFDDSSDEWCDGEAPPQSGARKPTSRFKS